MTASKFNIFAFQRSGMALNAAKTLCIIYKEGTRDNAPRDLFFAQAFLGPAKAKTIFLLQYKGGALLGRFARKIENR